LDDSIQFRRDLGSKKIRRHGHAIPSHTSVPIAFCTAMAPRKTTTKTRRTTRNNSSQSTLVGTVKARSKGGEEDQGRPHLYLLKSEPHEFSIDDLKNKGREEWDGIRNYAARNHMRQMREGDLCWFYHSSCKTPAIVGTCRIVRGSRPDRTAMDPEHKNYDPKLREWISCLVEFDSTLEAPITLKELKAQAKINSVIAGMMLLRQSRLSVMPVTRTEWNEVENLIGRKRRNEDLLLLG